MGLELLILGLLSARTTVDASVADRVDSGDPCEVARMISESPPCLDSKDCQAYDLWRRVVSEPGTVLADSGHSSVRSRFAGLAFSRSASGARIVPAEMANFQEAPPVVLPCPADSDRTE